MATCPECTKQFPDTVESCPEHGVPLVPDSVFANVDRDLEPGTRVGDYQVESKIGEGSFGRVYRAAHPIIGRRVAIKVLSRVLSTDPHAVSRFIAEARAIVEIQSPHIVDIYSFGALPDGRQYYIMELLDGDSLEAYLSQRSRLAPAEALRILAGMAAALSAAHAAGVVHRDLKPANVLVAFDTAGQPVPKLLDFGVAKLVGKNQLGHRTSTGALIGTPAYMAPEQALGLEVDHRADIYGFGLVAFELLTGQLPFEAESLVGLVRKHASEPPPLPSALRPELGDAFDAALQHMLEKDPADRPASIADCMDELRAAAVRGGFDFSAPTAVSLRPPPSRPSQPGGPLTDSRAATVPVDLREARDSLLGRRAGVSTVGGTAGASRPSAPPAPRRRLWIGATAAAGVVGGVILTLILVTGSPAVDPSAAPSGQGTDAGAASSSPASTPSAAAPSATPAPAAADVELRVESNAAGARVLVDGKDLGPAPGRFRLPRNDVPVRIEVRAPGHESALLTVAPTQDIAFEPTLVRAPSRATGAPPPTGAKPSPKPTATTTVHPDLAVPGG